MRIISGTAGGVHLVAPEGQDIRPTEDRVKESMFATIGDLTGKVVLDLFSGTGALGLEALSRGAAHVYSVEKDARHCELIRQNLQMVERVMATDGRFDLFCMDVAEASERLAAISVDVILADPPYETAAGAYGWRELMLDTRIHALMKQDGLLVLEHGSDKELPWYPESRWRSLRTKVFGIRAVSYAFLVADE